MFSSVRQKLFEVLLLIKKIDQIQRNKLKKAFLFSLHFNIKKLIDSSLQSHSSASILMLQALQL